MLVSYACRLCCNHIAVKEVAVRISVQVVKDGKWSSSHDSATAAAVILYLLMLLNSL